MPFLGRLSKKFAWLTLIVICAASFALMLHASQGDSAIMDELAHIPAGYGYVHNLDYRLNPEHPPLVKALAMVPVLFLNPVFPTNVDAWRNQVNAQWDMGYQFLYNAGNDANSILHTARFFPILLTLFLIVLIYLMARQLMGTWWALLPAFLIAFDPTILAHGHYVTTDIGAAFGILLALFFFTRFVESPTTKNLWLAGITFGIAMLCKFSTPLLVPLYIFLFAVVWIRDLIVQKKKFFASLGRHLWHLIAIGLIGYIVIVYPVYFLFTLHYPIAKQVSDTTFVLGSFAGGPAPVGQACHDLRCLADIDIKMAGNPLLRPFAEYMLGVLMVVQRADGGNTIYFLGHVVGSGGPIYFPLLYLLKEPVPTILIVFVALILAAWCMLKRAVRTPHQIFRNVLDYLGVSFTEFSLASFVVLYWGYSLNSPLNIGLRHVLPTLPLIAILAAVVWKKWVLRFDFSAGSASMVSFAKIAAQTLARAAAKYVFLVLLLVWLCLETLFAAPYFLSYFNEFGHGTANGYHYVTDSNYDWGQDLLRLKTWVSQQNDWCKHGKTFTVCTDIVDKIAVDYFGGGNPKYELGAREVDWSSSKGNPADQNIHWLAVSVNTLEGATAQLGPGQNRNASDTYSWLTALRPPQPGMGNVPPPDYRVGTSIFVYHL